MPKSPGVAPIIRAISDLNIKKSDPRMQERRKAEEIAVEASCFDFSISFFPKSTEIRLPAPAPNKSPKAWMRTITGITTPEAAAAAAAASVPILPR